MRKILFILNEYLSDLGPNAICLKKILPFFDKEDDIHVLSFECETINIVKESSNIHVHPIYVEQNKKSIISEIVRRKKNVRLGIKASLEIIKKYDISTVVSIVYPVESAGILISLKKKMPFLKTILYELDSISNRFKNPKKFYEKFYTFYMTVFEKKVFSYSDYIILMKTHEKHYVENSTMKKFGNKISISDIPSFDISKFHIYTQKPEGEVKFIFGGALYKELRSIDYCLDFFYNLKKSFLFKLSIYTNSIDVIDNYDFYKTEFDFYPLVSNKVFSDLELSSDILVSIGNKNSDFLPSKILSSIASGKIIIHFFSDPNDVSIPYLKRYPYSILIDERIDLSTNINAFLSNYAKLFNGNSVSKNQLLDYFNLNTPNYVANLFKGVIHEQ